MSKITQKNIAVGLYKQNNLWYFMSPKWQIDNALTSTTTWKAKVACVG